jgi:hypothetical protein
MGLSQTLSAQAAPANSLRELLVQLTACMDGLRIEENGQRISMAGWAAVTVDFILNREGTITNKPSIQLDDGPIDPSDRQREIAWTAAVIRRCFPLHLSPSYGASIAGTILKFTMPMVGSLAAPYSGPEPLPGVPDWGTMTITPQGYRR